MISRTTDKRIKVIERKLEAAYLMADKADDIVNAQCRQRMRDERRAVVQVNKVNAMARHLNLKWTPESSTPGHWQSTEQEPIPPPPPLRRIKESKDTPE